MLAKDFLKQVQEIDWGKVPKTSEVRFQAGMADAYAQSQSVPVDSVEFDGYAIYIYGA